MLTQLFKKVPHLRLYIFTALILFAGAILFKGCPSKSNVEYVEKLVIDSTALHELRLKNDSIEAANIALEERALVAERNVDIIARQIDKLGEKYKQHRINKDTGAALAVCDTIVQENEILHAKIDSSNYAHHLLIAGKNAQINTQKIMIDTLTGQNKVLTIENERLVKISNANADAAKKVQRKNKLNSLLTKVEAVVIVGLSLALAIQN